MTPLDVLSLRQLRAFESAARLESVSAAAREVNLSQPGLTQSIHALEARLAVRLFDRRRSGCYVTGLGAVLLPRVRRFFDHVGAALSEPVVGSPFVGRHDAAAAVNRITGAQMRGLIAIAESHSIDAAARRLAVAQPSLQRTARDLERALKRSLYQRTARGVTANAQGAELARRFRVALQEIKYGLEEIHAAQGSVVSRIAVGSLGGNPFPDATPVFFDRLADTLSSGLDHQTFQPGRRDQIKQRRAGDEIKRPIKRKLEIAGEIDRLRGDVQSRRLRQRERARQEAEIVVH